MLSTKYRKLPYQKRRNELYYCVILKTRLDTTRDTVNKQRQESNFAEASEPDHRPSQPPIQWFLGGGGEGVPGYKAAEA
jgi:hypothetical protein